MEGADLGPYIAGSEVEVTIGEGNTKLTQLLDKVVMSMTEGETAYIKSKVKSDGSKVDNFDTKSALKFNIVLKSFSRAADVQDLEPDEKLERAQLHKDSGTQMFVEGKLDFSIQRYQKSLDYLCDMEPLGSLPESLSEQHQKLMTQCYLNLGAAYLKQDKYEHVVENCTKALIIEPQNIKGLFRRGQAYTKQHKYTEAKKDLQAALKLEPQNKAVVTQVRTVDELIRKEKDLYKKMMGQ